MLKSSEPRQCTVERQDHQFCGRESAPDTPFPICHNHALDLYRHMAAEVEAATEDPLLMLTIGMQEMDARRAKRIASHLPADDKGSPVIYYLMVGDLVKIGFATKIDQRLRAYPPNARLLATEPGGRDLERARHDQFKHLLSQGREWFAPGEELRRHIEGLSDYRVA